MGTNGDYWGLNFMGATGKTIDEIPQVSKSSHYLPPCNINRANCNSTTTIVEISGCPDVSGHAFRPPGGKFQGVMVKYHAVVSASHRPAKMEYKSYRNKIPTS